MVLSPLAIANAPGARRGVTVYRPGAMARPVAPTARTNGPRAGAATRPRGGADWGSIKERVLTTEAAQKHQQKKAEDEAAEDQPLLGKGLGMILGNPIVSNVLKPLGALGMLGRGVTYGVEQVAEATEDLPTWTKFMGPPGQVLAGIDLLVDTERTARTTARSTRR